MKDFKDKMTKIDLQQYVKNITMKKLLLWTVLFRAGGIFFLLINNILESEINHTERRKLSKYIDSRIWTTGSATFRPEVRNYSNHGNESWYIPEWNPEIVEENEGSGNDSDYDSEEDFEPSEILKSKLLEFEVFYQKKISEYENRLHKSRV